MLISYKLCIINIVYFHFSSSILVKECFVELLCRIKKNDFSPALFISAYFFVISREGMYWSIYCKWNVFLFVCVYFVYYDTLTKFNHNRTVGTLKNPIKLNTVSDRWPPGFNFLWRIENNTYYLEPLNYSSLTSSKATGFSLSFISLRE